MNNITIYDFREKLSNEYEIFFNTKKLIRILNNDELEKEIWKQVIYKGKYYDYEVSNKGKVRTLNTHKILSDEIVDGRYRNVTLWDSETKTKKLVGIHRLMALAFIPIPKKYIKAGYNSDKLVINHKDGYKRHNMLYNLEWCTVKENMTHAIDHNLVGYLGENSHLSKITEKEAIKICELISKGYNNEYIHNKTSVSSKTIQHIRSGECWKHISCKYTFPKLSTVKPNTTNIETVKKICELLQEKKYKDKEIGMMVGKSREYVKDIRTRRRLKNISKDYDF